MTIDSHSYLVSRGWKGKGNGLQEGGIARPVVQAQKKDQKGLGKNRDDGFQFWDHVYAVAADAIQIHVENSEEEAENAISTSGSFSQDVATAAGSSKQGKQTPKLSVTQTGILSHRRPTKLQDAAMGEPTTRQTGRTGMDLLVLAKREAAKRELYSRFYHGGMVNQDETTSRSDRDKERCATAVADRGATEPAVDRAGLDEKERRKEEKRRRKEEKRASKKRKVQEENGQEGPSKRHRRGSTGSS